MPRVERQYTLRNVPTEVDAALRRRARAQGKSLNQVLLDVLTEAAGIGRVFDDLDFMIGSMSAAEAEQVAAAAAATRRIDPGQWK